MVQSDHGSIQSMSKLLTNKYHTVYSKAKAIYNFMIEYIEVLEYNEVNYSALDVYESYQGTKKENILYLAALLRAQDIPTKIVEGSNSYVSHRWAEAYLNGQWIIIDPYGDAFRMDTEELNVGDLLPGFNSQRALYTSRYPTINGLEY
jgi:transglutaminase-like putative cysteine protease